MIVFTTYRETAILLAEKLTTQGKRAEIFIGQTKKLGKGLTQKEQKKILDEFRAGTFQVLIATSVGEEGLDIPLVNLVVFYEPTPSAIRQIQRRGRTARHEKGRVIILSTKGTIDEAYKWSAHHKEKRMHTSLAQLKQKLQKGQRSEQETLAPSPLSADTSFPTSSDGKVISPTIYADHREKGNKIVKELLTYGVTIQLTQLQHADYVLSERVGVEFKTKEDFIQSILDGRLLEQIRELRRAFDRPLLILEGEEDIYSIRNVHPHALQGMLATIAISYNIPIIYTKHPRETASLLRVIALREQESHEKEFSPHASRKPTSTKEQQEYIISSLPGVGPTLAKDLLTNFGSVRGVVLAEKEKLKKVTNVGEKTAHSLRELIDSPYQK